MNYREHIQIGLVVELCMVGVLGVLLYFDVISVVFTWPLGIQLLVILFISPLSPDLDHYNGKLREIWIGLGLLMGGYGVVLDWLDYSGTPWMTRGILVSLLPFVIPYVTTHRGILHSIFFNTCYVGILYLITQNIYVSLVGGAGFYSHLAADKVPIKVI